MTFRMVHRSTSTLGGGMKFNLGAVIELSWFCTVREQPRLHYRDRDTMEFAGFPVGSLVDKSIAEENPSGLESAPRGAGTSSTTTFTD